MKYINLSNVLNDGKESEKRINYISNRIKSLENDINEIKKRENLTFFSPNKKYIDNNNNKKQIMTIEEYKSKPKSKYEINDKNYNNILFNSYNNYNFISKNKSKKLYEKKILKKNNNYNNSIHEKKKFLLNNDSQINKNIQITSFINKDKNLYKLRPYSNNNSNKIRQLFYFNKTNKKNDEINKEEKTKHYNSKHIEKLEYEFEIRLLKKKINILKKKNKEIKEKLNKIKNINENMENNLTGNGNNLLNDIILLNKQYMSYNREYEFNNKNINDKLYFENIILNIMDLKYIYDNDLLINEFIDGVNKLLNISLLSQNNEKSNLNNLVEKINQLIDLKNNLYNNINKYEYLLKENNKYYIYFTSLLNNLNLKNIFELDKFIKNAYIKNIKENDHMKKITDTLFNESLSTNQKTERKNHHSSNQLMNSYSKSINNIINNKNYKLQNFLNNKKSDSRINPNKIDYFLINRRRKYSNNFTKKTLNRTERIENISNSYITNQDDKNIVYQHNKNNSLAYSIKPYTTTNKRRKKRKININLFEQRNNDFYRINNKFNKTDNINQNGLLNNDNDMNDIKYYNNINEKNTINKQVNNNNFDKNFYGHVKNHSVIIFNK